MKTSEVMFFLFSLFSREVRHNIDFDLIRDGSLALRHISPDSDLERHLFIFLRGPSTDALGVFWNLDLHWSMTRIRCSFRHALGVRSWLLMECYALHIRHWLVLFKGRSDKL